VITYYLAVECGIISPHNNISFSNNCCIIYLVYCISIYYSIYCEWISFIHTNMW